MADTSLDDFFAKKDKSKKKPKSKSGDGNNSDTTKLKKEKRKDKEKLNAVPNSGTKSLVNRKEDDAEWNDFEEEKAVDYSGLRIQNLQIAKDEPEKEGDMEDEEYDEDGEVIDKRDASGPWKKTSSQAKTPVVVEAPKPKDEPVSTPKAPGKYVPPAQRMAAASTTLSGGYSVSRRKKEAPNVNSEFDFPTLGGCPGGGSDNSGMNSVVVENPNQRGMANLTLENKFSALQD